MEVSASEFRAVGMSGNVESIEIYGAHGAGNPNELFKPILGAETIKDFDCDGCKVIQMYIKGYDSREFERRRMEEESYIHLRGDDNTLLRIKSSFNYYAQIEGASFHKEKGGVTTIDENTKIDMIGYELGTGAASGFIVAGGDIEALRGKIKMLKGDYKDYWYTYYGYESSGYKGFVSDVLSVNIGAQSIIGVNKTGDFDPKTIAREALYITFTLDAPVASIEYQVAVSRDWIIVSHGLAFGLGTGNTIGVTITDYRGGKINAYLSPFTTIKKTEDRSWFDKRMNKVQTRVEMTTLFGPVGAISSLLIDGF